METSTLSRFITETVFTTKTIPAAVLTALSEKNGKSLTTELFQDLISQDYTLLEKLQSVPEKYDKNQLKTWSICLWQLQLQEESCKVYITT